MNKSLLSVLAIAAFALLAFASTVNKIHLNAFKYDNAIEDPSPQGNYLEMADGSRLFGTKIKQTGGLFSKAKIKIDEESYPTLDVKGYREGNSYYIRLGKAAFIKRIVRGRINVYVHIYQTTSTYVSQGRTYTSNNTRTDHYAERDNSGQLTVIAGQREIQELVRDCPKALEMASLSDRELRRAIKKDRNYMNSIFEVYNNGCKP